MRRQLALAALIYFGMARIAGSCEPPVEAPHPRQDAEIQRLIADLDSGDFQTRDRATTALARIGEPALPLLVPNGQFGPEANARIRRVREEVRRAAVALPTGRVRLDSIFEEVRNSRSAEWNPECLELHLTRLVETVSSSTGNEKLQLPVRFRDVRDAAPNERLGARNNLVRIERGRVSVVQDSIVLADSAVDISSAQNSIIIARCAIQVRSVRNSIVLAGFDLNASIVRESLLLSGSQGKISMIDNSVVGARDQLSVAIVRSGTVVNSEIERLPPRDAPQVLELKNLVLRGAPQKNPLEGKLRITTAVPADGGLIVFRREDGTGEYVARTDAAIAQPDGTPIPELAGWTVHYVGYGFAVLRNGDQQVYLKAEKSP